VLQCGAECCHMFQYVAVIVFPRFAVCCSVLQPVCCRVLQ